MQQIDSEAPLPAACATASEADTGQPADAPGAGQETSAAKDELNAAQRILLNTYGHGEFVHVRSTADARKTADTLFLFLFLELSTGEDCDGMAEAKRRMNAVQLLLEKLTDRVQEALDTAEQRAGGQTPDPALAWGTPV